MKNAKLIIISTFLIATSAITAQDSRIGFRVGLNIPSLTQREDNIFADGFESVPGIEIALMGELGLTDHWSLKSEIIYTTRGGERNEFQPIPPANIPPELAAQLPAGTIPYATYNNESKPRYIEIPVMISYGFGDKWRFYVNAGPYIGILVSAKQKTSGESAIFLDPKGQIPVTVDTPGGPVVIMSSFDAEEDVKDDLENINFGIQGGIGILRKLNEKHELFFDIRGSTGFIPIQKDESLGETVVGGLVLSLGYSYNFGS